MYAVIGILSKESQMKTFKVIILAEGENIVTFYDSSIVPGEDYLAILRSDNRSILYSSKIPREK